MVTKDGVGRCVVNNEMKKKLGLIAGRGVYPLLLAESARKQGVPRIFAVAFKRETDPAIARAADEVAWVRIGQLDAMFNALRASGVEQVVMAGQITPTHLFRVRPDRRMLDMLKRLHPRNAETIFGAITGELKREGMEVLPAHLFMESAMPDEGLLGSRAPTDSELRDIELGFRAAKVTSGLEIGQTIVVKEGTILAVEAFEGTDETLIRAGKLGGPGAVVVKVAKQGHDMRFDIPVVGTRTMKILRKIKASVLAVEARRTILLERDKLIEQADGMGLCLCAKERIGTSAREDAGPKEEKHGEDDG